MLTQLYLSAMVAGLLAIGITLIVIAMRADRKLKANAAQANEPSITYFDELDQVTRAQWDYIASKTDQESSGRSAPIPTCSKCNRLIAPTEQRYFVDGTDELMCRACVYPEWKPQGERFEMSTVLAPMFKNTRPGEIAILESGMQFRTVAEVAIDQQKEVIRLVHLAAQLKAKAEREGLLPIIEKEFAKAWSDCTKAADKHCVSGDGAKSWECQCCGRKNVRKNNMMETRGVRYGYCCVGTDKLKAMIQIGNEKSFPVKIISYQDEPQSTTMTEPLEQIGENTFLDPEYKAALQEYTDSRKAEQEAEAKDLKRLPRCDECHSVARATLAQVNGKQLCGWCAIKQPSVLTDWKDTLVKRAEEKGELGKSPMEACFREIALCDQVPRYIEAISSGVTKTTPEDVRPCKMCNVGLYPHGRGYIKGDGPYCAFCLYKITAPKPPEATE